MQQLDEVSRTARELRERIEQQMDLARQRDEAAGDDPEVIRARKTSRRR